MSKYAALVNENRRLEILRVLAQDPGYQLNERLIQDALGLVGIASSVDQVRSAGAWLREQGLAEIEELSGIYLIRATRRGLDVAEGRAVVPGVARPLPEA
ncbi:hypothetical protein SAMN05660653_00175 [Desulfonatronum thiosulfatophilum]|uniref:ArsR family transcriptional regulator n=1 Tax=Desulfonatronum thiosulfatophilum TaxID=617002 RepID=A0A1G6A5Z9_9BACT|nr:hypothetical protein [Desulfonatronum thiosulfatophilum]SDB03809.1 hypothetical protein SAMN05660653_00175 [Desulfonatronum thiosulfatophilum]